MADRPILFSGPMVRALFDGKKTQTRRVHFTQTPSFIRTCAEGCDHRLAGMCIRKAESCGRREVTHARFTVGDRLWVRETWAVSAIYDGVAPREINPEGKPRWCGIAYPATREPEGLRHRPGIHMPRWASRLTLAVTRVRVQRLHELTAADALAEGVEMESADPPFYYVPGVSPHSLTAVGVEDGKDHARRSYAKFWDLLNAKRGFGWEANPWVVALNFSVAHTNIDTAREEVAA